ncbi:2-desacetyl-2-hydroxyethyl bacteriochlorophyllide A dehydrogenase [Sphingomonas sp. BE138]|uniref:zinc-binding alcohol dehydrogenase family protein n=1 Tax=Sphingomonas sp. BE138 TaxID=2817845 RepID=UPI002855D56A|nr:zinc-binding alcohol dehydrogenase family protein [Sphingomonas sp. BE138]MDR6787748.1 2-desacetyl-2-hydroxyethyl bacteriochlorophyllide A dehydrogenase [Sphingomonas sp. BE138]
MRAILCREPFALEQVERPAPVLADGEVLVHIRRVGLCGTDYHIYAGNQPFLSYPRVMGHELAGEIAAVPVGSALRVGERVTINPYLSCGTCIACRKGKPNCCTRIAVLGVHTDGGMQDMIAVPERAVIPADDLTLEQAAMVEFLAIGAHAVARAKLSPGDRVLVAGAGPIGIAVALFARLDGARVTIIDTRASRLAHARDRLGFDDVATVDDRIRDTLAARTHGDFFDCVFDATGNIHAMRAGLDHVANGGSYVLVSVVPDDLIFADPEFHRRETTLIASRNALSTDFDRVLAAVRGGDIPTDALHTHSVDAGDLPERMPRLIAEADHVLKAIVTF